ncbi:MAG: hypothetical protein UZ22_OP11002000761 [Microgenomates bacterium OLB23]|nr:MAG: hypothetical protein UZ22_OP11002000761 [Microgenomates bacterium OLB23]
MLAVLTAFFVVLSRWYTATMLLLSIIAIIKTTHMRFTTHNSFFYALVLLLTTVFNGFLTSLPVVTYNPAFLSGLRISTIPLEDYIFGLLLIYTVITLYTTHRNTAKT